MAMIKLSDWPRKGELLRTCRASKKRLGEEAGMSRNTLIRALNELLNREMIHTKRRGKSGLSSAYYVGLVQESE
jgi:DNA-binding transcriptional regulator YhcF (GntR family)